MAGLARSGYARQEDAGERRTYGALMRDLARELGSSTRARWVLAAATGRRVSEVSARVGEAVDSAVEQASLRIAGRILSGEPLQYALGSWEFRQLEVRVDERALIPRPETECVVEFALGELARISSSGGRSAGERRPLVAVELGTGSGVIALSLAAELSVPAAGFVAGLVRGFQVLATDSSEDALELARENLDGLARSRPASAARVVLLQGDWFDALPAELAGGIDLVVSNPPYLSVADWDEVEDVIRDHEPHGALVAGERGLEALERIVDESPRWIAPGGSLVLELAPRQADRIRRRARAAGFVDAEVRRDLSGLDRALVARRSEEPDRRT